MKMMLVAASAAALLSATAASATAYVVDALANSSSGGAGVSTLALTAGQTFTVSVAAGDLWNAGALPRWSNADGLTGPLFATGSDDSGQPAGTQIGADFGLWSQGGLSAPYGMLVGRIGAVYQALGTSFSGPAWGTGTLELFYWDSNFADNTQFITADVATAVPEASTWAMLISGFGLVGLAARRRRGVTITA